MRKLNNLFNINEFLLLEKKDFRKKIRNFLNYDKIIDLSHDLSPKFSVWVANVIKNKMIEYIDKHGFKDDSGKEINFLKILKEGPKTEKEESLLNTVFETVHSDIK